jgi:predicted nucleic-acid-binding protein
MIGLDANILVRYLTQDDPVQARQATELIENRLTSEGPRFVSVVAIAETAWVLRRSYRFDRARVAAAIELMLSTDALILEREREVYLATDALKEGRGEFPTP